MNRTLKTLLVSAGLCSLPSLCFSAIVYDNTTATLNGQYSPSTPTFEFGDQVTLDTNNVIDRTMTQFTFYSFLTAPSLTTQSATLRFYNNLGNNPPVTPFYTTEPVPLTTTGFGSYTINFSVPVTLPDEFTWTVQFSNLGAGETGALLLYGPPNVGSSFNDFWQKDAGGVWNLMQINGGAVRADFAAQITAVPEPGVLALGGIGALLLAGLRRLRKAPR